jgi:hypothetical protein
LDRRAEAVFTAYDKLTLSEKYRLGKVKSQIRQSLRAERSWPGLSESGAIELLGKLGMWLIEKDKNERIEGCTN